MKKKSIVLLALILSLALFFVGCGGTEEDPAANQEGQENQGSQEGDSSWAKIQDKGKFVVGLDDNYPPAGFRDADGELVGIDIDLAKEAAKRLGVEVEFQPVQWDGVLMNLKNGDIDVIWNALGVTPEREEQIAFTKVYMIDKNIIVVPVDSPIKTKADLAGKVIGLQAGSTAEPAVTGDPVGAELKEIRKFENPTQALLDLQAGRIDAVVTNEMNGRFLITQDNAQDKYYILSEEEGYFGEEPYAVGLRKEDETFLAELNRALDEMKADGAAAEISEKWFGANIIE
ncbi:MAG: amino acid ABC transporter substrate-binding protein [Dehalobacterium sp.]|jgi:polar amino acid transport system substrate-binding protein